MSQRWRRRKNFEYQRTQIERRYRLPFLVLFGGLVALIAYSYVEGFFGISRTVGSIFGLMLLPIMLFYSGRIKQIGSRIRALEDELQDR